MSYQPMQGAWYRVLTLDGEVIEKMQFRQGALHGLRGRVVALAQVERVAVRYAPGVSGGVNRFLVVNPSPAEHDPGYRVPVFERQPSKPRAAYGELPAEIVLALAEHGPQTTDGLTALLGSRTCGSVRAALSRMARVRTVSRRLSDKLWQLGAPEIAADLADDAPVNTAPWKPGAWLHPNRAESLGLSVSRRRDMAPLPLDFADPRRRAA